MDKEAPWLSQSTGFGALVLLYHCYTAGVVTMATQVLLKSRVGVGCIACSVSSILAPPLRLCARFDRKHGTHTHAHTQMHHP